MKNQCGDHDPNMATILKNDIYTHNFEIYSDYNQVWQLFKMRHLTK